MHELKADLDKQKKEMERKAQENTQGVAMANKRVEAALQDGLKKIEAQADAATKRQNEAIAQQQAVLAKITGENQKA